MCASAQQERIHRQTGCPKPAKQPQGTAVGNYDIGGDIRWDRPGGQHVDLLAGPGSVTGSQPRAFAAAAATATWAWAYLLLAILWWPAAVIAVAVGATGWARARAAIADLTALSEAAVDLHGRALAIAEEDSAGPLTLTEGEQLTALIRKGR